MSSVRYTILYQRVVLKRLEAIKVHKDTKKLIDLVGERRKALGISLRSLARLTGLSFSTLARLERGEGTEPEEITTARLANWLGKDAQKAGFKPEQVIEVHFRAPKHISPKAVESLAAIAELIQRHYGRESGDRAK